jgi:ubiquinone/menaquinone biosynthesis C-methylase UbiE
MSETSADNTKTRLEVMRRFDGEAFQFDVERAAAGYRLRYRLVRNLFGKEIRFGSVALDQGCGTGEYSVSLAREGFDVVGGDFSKSMLEVARSKVRKEHREIAERIHLIRLDSVELPFRDKSFEIATCIALLDYVGDPLRLLVETGRVLKPRAKLIACVDAPWNPYRKIQLATTRGNIYNRITGSRELQHKFKASGFIVTKFFGDVLLAQVVSNLLFDPNAAVLANRILKATRPFDSLLANLPLLKFFSAHYIIEARKK